MRCITISLFFLLIFSFEVYGQSASFQTYMNPVIPGDHPDATLTKIGDDFYTTGSSFNITPKIYHSTDLVHWQVIAQPVKASWSLYGDEPAGGIWGGHMVLYNDSYWHFFGRGSNMYYVKADAPEGPWSNPITLSVPAGIPGLGRDNSIFIDDDNKWYLLAKNGQSGNWIVELGDNGQPTGNYHDLTWINPAPEYPYSWAEGPVMWKHGGYYYYSFARNVAGGQYVMRSEELTGDKDYWWAITDFFESVPNANEILFKGPNHCSPVIMLDDGTSWVLSQAYSQGTLEWHGQGRQGLLHKVNYDMEGNVLADYTSNDAVLAPALPSSGIPWMVPHSDYFSSDKLNPEWSFSGYTPDNTHSLTERPGWFKLSPRGKPNTIVKNDGEHNYSLITKFDFEPESNAHEVGLWIFNGLETLYAKLNSTMNDSGKTVISFSFTGGSNYEAENTIGDTLWLKMYRDNHLLSGYYSSDGINWIQVGEAIDVSDMDKNQPNYNGWIGNQQGLYVQGKAAYFDLYIYRDAYSPIMAQPAANQYGTLRVVGGTAPAYLDSIHHNDWALYAGVEFGGKNYYIKPDSIIISAASGSSGGVIEVWLDSIDTGQKIGECTIENTGGWDNFQLFKSQIDSVYGMHDVYLKFTGAGNLFRIDWFKFTGTSYIPTSINNNQNTRIGICSYELHQNYPNPFNPVTRIKYSVPISKYITLKVYNILGEEVMTLFEGIRQPGTYTVTMDGRKLSSGIYFYQLKAENYIVSKKLMVLK
ncbi:MAG: family 43 glycosylhydrolase [Calditrichaceae bacterium]|nr:family 43 glycosylhydrolase [Calditrichaceae bacterium]MBN2708094.1 family 43 glycosylhydrolase [Calditrichaceae bacterium]RQV94766.1 MAG: carbohydrate-binding protein [Calditrichota bacterium]